MRAHEQNIEYNKHLKTTQNTCKNWLKYSPQDFAKIPTYAENAFWKKQVPAYIENGAASF
jgi:hypothetical protein